MLERLGPPDAAARAAEYAKMKQARIERLIEQGHFEASPDAIRLASAPRAQGLQPTLALSSKNADAVLRQIRLPDGTALLSLFDANLSGRGVPHGKLDPTLCLLAAEALGVPPAQCIVVEDAPTGVKAARAGGMTALAIARLHDEALLRQAGAELVLTSLDRLDIPALATGALRARLVPEAASDA